MHHFLHPGELYAPIMVRTIHFNSYNGKQDVFTHLCDRSFLSCRTTTSAPLLWIRMLPSCWLCWASGTSTSSTRRHTPCCPMTSTCTASLPTSNRSASTMPGEAQLQFHIVESVIYKRWTEQRWCQWSAAIRENVTHVTILIATFHL